MKFDGWRGNKVWRMAEVEAFQRSVVVEYRLWSVVGSEKLRVVAVNQGTEYWVFAKGRGGWTRNLFGFGVGDGPVAIKKVLSDPRKSDPLRLKHLWNDRLGKGYAETLVQMLYQAKLSIQREGAF